jgi:putative hemin transport protein
MTALKERIAAYRTEHPRAYARDIAAAIGVSEAELVSSNESAIRLMPQWPALLRRLSALGRLKTITRNDAATLECWGSYEEIEVGEQVGQVVGSLHLRLFLGAWSSAFILTESTAQGLRRSLQIFDRQGAAVHKIYIEDQSKLNDVERLIKEFRSDAIQPLALYPYPEKKSELLDSEIEQKKFCAAWDGLRHKHELFGLLRSFGMNRRQAFRLAGEARAQKVSSRSVRGLLRSASTQRLPLVISVGNPGMLQSYRGIVKRFTSDEKRIDVLDSCVNFHLLANKISEAWVVRKPGHGGVISSLELLDKKGESAVIFCEKREQDASDSLLWSNLLTQVTREPLCAESR